MEPVRPCESEGIRGEFSPVDRSEAWHAGSGEVCETSSCVSGAPSVREARLLDDVTDAQVAVLWAGNSLKSGCAVYVKVKQAESRGLGCVPSPAPFPSEVASRLLRE